MPRLLRAFGFGLESRADGVRDFGGRELAGGDADALDAREIARTEASVASPVTMMASDQRLSASTDRWSK